MARRGDDHRDIHPSGPERGKAFNEDPTIFTINYNGVELSREDFGDDLRSWVAFSIAFTGNTYCRDREAALELLYYEADKIISKVTGVPMPDDDDEG